MKKILNSKLLNLNSYKGFSLTEFVVYAGLLTILVSVLVSIFVAILDTQKQSDATSGVDQNARYILSRLIYDIQSAQSITTPASLGQQTANLQLVINTINYSYSADNNGNFTITNNNGTDNLNGYDASISAATFKRIGNSGGKNSVQVNFTVASRTIKRGGPEIKTYQTTIGTR